jgi:hypothetical protein
MSDFEDNHVANQRPWGNGRTALIAAVVILALNCAGLIGALISKNKSSALATTTTEDSQPKSSEQADITDQPETAQKASTADHNYMTRIGDTYYYQTAISEADRIEGKAASTTYGMRHVECRKKGDVCLASVDNRGLILMSIACTPPCQIIRYGNGETMAFNRDSVAGAALEDAMRGKLVKTTLYGPKYGNGINLSSPSSIAGASPSEVDNAESGAAR